MNREFQDKLVGAEPENSDLRAEYERRLTAMLETPLTWYRKTGLVFAMLACAATVVVAGVAAFRFRHGPAAVLEGMAVGAAFGLVGLILLVRILRRGVYRLGADSMAQAGLIWVFVVLLETIFMVAGGMNSIQGIGLTIFGMVFMIGAGVILLRTVIEQSELRTREKLLELELRLSKINDEIGKLGHSE